MVKLKNGLQGNLTVPLVEEGAVPDYGSFPLTAFHRINDKGNKKPIPDRVPPYEDGTLILKTKKKNTEALYFLCFCVVFFCLNSDGC